MSTRAILFPVGVGGRPVEFGTLSEACHFLGISSAQMANAISTGHQINGYFVDEAITDAAGIPDYTILADVEEAVAKKHIQKGVKLQEWLNKKDIKNRVVEVRENKQRF